MTSADLEHIRAIEEVAADAVPAAVVERLDGWRLRFNFGVKRRPNSVLANADGGEMGLTAKLERAEAFYAAHGLKARFQLCPASVPAGLDAVLEARGYARAPEAVCVQVADLKDIRFPAVGPVLLEQPTQTFLDLYCDIEGLTGVKAEAFRDMLTKLPGEAVFALAHDVEDRPAAVGVGVAHGGRLGLFNIATHPDARRQGLASAVVGELCRWGKRKGLSEAYLQVAMGNLGARAVYERLGFRTLYEYFYLEQR